MSFKKVVISIADIADPIIDAYESGEAIFKRVASAMESVEREGKIKEGAKKKDWVLAYSKEIIEDIKAEWPVWRSLIADFIDKIIKIYNAIAKVVKK